MLSTSIEDKEREIRKLICCGRWAEAEKYLLEVGKSENNLLAAWHFAFLELLRFVLSGDNNLIPTCVKRWESVEELAESIGEDAYQKLLDGTDDARSYFQQLTFSSKFTNPWCTNLEQVELTEQAKIHLNLWRNSTGLISFASLIRGILELVQRPGLLKGASALYLIKSSWSNSRSASLDQAKTSREAFESSSLALMVKSLFLVLLAKVPYHFQVLLKGIGFTVDEKEGLRILEEVSQVNQDEIHMISVCFRSLYHLMLSQQEYDSNSVEAMRRANNLIEAFHTKHPKYILSSWIRTHICRRQGRVPEAVVCLDQISQIVKEESLAVDNRFVSYRLDFDRAILKLTNYHFAEAIDLLNPLVSEESTFGAKMLATVVLSGALAKIGKYDEAKEKLENLNNLENENTGRVDKSLMRKYQTLIARKHKALVVFEVLYIFGHMKARNPETAYSVADACTWLDRNLEEISKIENDMNLEPEDLAGLTPSEENSILSEQLCVCLLIRGAIMSLKGERELAKSTLTTLVEGIERNPELEYKDPYFYGWALYELGVIHLKLNNNDEALNFFTRAENLAKANETFSFAHILQYKCIGALRSFQT